MGNCGTGIDHCCYFKGEACQYVIAVNRPPFKWACSLRDELGSWDAVYKDPRYIKNVKPKMSLVAGAEHLDCGDWPEKTAHKNCRECNG